MKSVNYSENKIERSEIRPGRERERKEKVSAQAGFNNTKAYVV